VTAKAQRLRVTVRAEQCAGNGGCRASAPTVFGRDESGWVVLLDPSPSVEQVDEVLEAQAACPLALIDVYDEEGTALG
jgi:ferredoxin